MSKEQHDKAREAMDLLGENAFGLLVTHRGYTMRLAWDGGAWSAMTDVDDVNDDGQAVEGLGDTPVKAMDDAAEEAEAIENPDGDGEAEEDED